MIKTITIAILLILITSCGNIEKPMDYPNNVKALNKIKKEPKVQDAIITDANVLYVNVSDDGTRRDGFAEYLCQILREQNATTNWVKIVKSGSSNDPNKDNSYGVLLGESLCN